MPYVFLGYCEGTKAYHLMCVETKRIINSRNVMFLKRTREVEGVHDNKPPSNQIEHVFVHEIVNNDELIKNANCISLKQKPIEDMEGDESTSNFFSKEEFATPQDEGSNESQEDGRRERPQRQRKEWPRDWWVATKDVEWATIAFSEEPQIVEVVLNGENAKKWEMAM
jgi:hypothetical protein